MTKTWIVILYLLLTISNFGCSNTSEVNPPASAEIINTSELLNKVTLGMSREEVENLLGKPYSVQEEISKDPHYKGVEVTALYSPKLRRLEQQIIEDMQANKNIETSKSILSAALSIVGSIIPSAGIASSVGNSTIGVAGDLATNPVDTNAMDPNKIESALVIYRKGKVESISRRNLSAGPR